MLSLLRLEWKQKNSTNSVRIRLFLFLLLICNWNDKYVHTLPKFPQKPYPIPDENRQSGYPFSDQNGAKSLPDGVAHTYIYSFIGSTPRPGLVYGTDHETCGT